MPRALQSSPQNALTTFGTISSMFLFQVLLCLIYISDHYPIFSLFDISSINKSFTKIIRDHSTDNSNKLCDDVREMCEIFINEHNNKNVDEKCSWFVEKLYSLYNCNCPRKCKTISAKRVVIPWITKNLKRMAI